MLQEKSPLTARKTTSHSRPSLVKDHRHGSRQSPWWYQPIAHCDAKRPGKAGVSRHWRISLAAPVSADNANGTTRRDMSRDDDLEALLALKRLSRVIQEETKQMPISGAKVVFVRNLSRGYPKASVVWGRRYRKRAAAAMFHFIVSYWYRRCQRILWHLSTDLRFPSISTGFPVSSSRVAG
jgi:hypothetical protein